MQFGRTRILGGVVRSLAALTLWLGVGFAPAYAGKRVALVIGNSTYTNLTPLSNPHHDARAVAELLKSLGWDVIEGVNLSFVQLHDAVAELEGKANGADVGLVYYAGHGMSYQNRDFVAPTDMPEHCASDALKRVFPLERFFQAVDGAQRKVVLLDACRNQPFPNCAKRGGEGGFRGLARIQSSGLLIVSATGPGGVAEDGAPGAHSPFARVLLDNFRTHPDIYLHDLLLKVVKDVYRETKERQTPELVLRGLPPETCLAAAGCGSLASVPEDDARMRQQAEAARHKALEETEQLRKRLKEDTEKAAERAALLRKEAEDAEQRVRDAAGRAEAVRREMQEAEERRRRERETQEAEERRRREQEAARPACGWFAIAYCSQSHQAAQAYTGAYSGYVINTSDSRRYPSFRAGWFCVVQGPMGRDAALSVVQRMKASGASTAYAKNSC